MTSLSGRGRWERVLAARAQAREALGRGPEGGDLYAAPPKAKTVPPTRPALVAPIRHPSERVEYVLLLDEAAVRLGVSRTTLDAMIDQGKIETLQGEFIRVIPTREVVRLTKGNRPPQAT